MTAPVLVPLAADAQISLAERIYLAACLVVLGAVLVTLGRMGARRTLMPNALFGIRTRRTMRSERVWYEVHAVAAPWMLTAGFVAFIGIIPVLLLREDFVFLTMLLSVGTSLVITVVGAVGAQRRVTAPERQADR
ncbi:MAG: SdpI family protein [Microbispora sp.]|nr:SdpI family protein [Microbispora sp.]